MTFLEKRPLLIAGKGVYHCEQPGAAFFMVLNVTIFTQNKLSINVNTKCLNAFCRLWWVRPDNRHQALQQWMQRENKLIYNFITGTVFAEVNVDEAFGDRYALSFDDFMSQNFCLNREWRRWWRCFSYF